MKCAICNATLSPPEIQWNNDHKDWDPCTRCIDEINEVFNDDSEDEINQQLTLELDLDEVEDEEQSEENT